MQVVSTRILERELGSSPTYSLNSCPFIIVGSSLLHRIHSKLRSSTLYCSLESFSLSLPVAELFSFLLTHPFASWHFTVALVLAGFVLAGSLLVHGRLVDPLRCTLSCMVTPCRVICCWQSRHVDLSPLTRSFCLTKCHLVFLLLVHLLSLIVSRGYCV